MSNGTEIKPYTLEYQETKTTVLIKAPIEEMPKKIVMLSDGKSNKLVDPFNRLTFYRRVSGNLFIQKIRKEECITRHKPPKKENKENDSKNHRSRKKRKKSKGK